MKAIHFSRDIPLPDRVDIQIEQTTSVKARIVNVYRTRVLFISMQAYAKNVPSIYHNAYMP